MTTFKIHPAIGIARLGNSEQFYLSPEQIGSLPIECDERGHEITNSDGLPQHVSHFKEEGDLSKVKRQAARFRVFAYKDENDTQGQEIKIGNDYEFTDASGLPHKGTVTDIVWTVHLANKKASWYEFQETSGRHGYAPNHPLRNPEITQADQRRQLIIDPGPQRVALNQAHIADQARFTKGENPGYPQTFPPNDIAPNTIETLGELKVNEQDGHSRLIVLGAYGNSGSINTPVITNFANNDGWFDDTSDGPVTATIVYEIKAPRNNIRQMQVPVPAWAVVGYPSYAPELPDMITMDEAMYDLSVRHFAYQPALFGVGSFSPEDNSPSTETEWRLWRAQAKFNPDYYPKFHEEIWPILERPNSYADVFDFNNFGGGDPHNTGTGGPLDKKAMSQPPSNDHDPNLEARHFINVILRQANQENAYRSGPIATSRDPNYRPRLMPLLAGHNPLTNTAPEKFLRLTDTQLFLLQQWADGKFVNECEEWSQCESGNTPPSPQALTTGMEIDRGVLANVLGGAFCPGGELGWIMLNPAIYSDPYRIHHAKYQAGGLSLPSSVEQPGAQLHKGLEPGDLTKYMGIPWQADFHECTTQDIDITYSSWNNIDLASTGDPAQQAIAYEIPWWPAHRPLIVRAEGDNSQCYWSSGLSDNNAGNLQMVTEWKNLGFMKNTPDGLFQTERNDQALGPMIPSGHRKLGQDNRSKKRG